MFSSIFLLFFGLDAMSLNNFFIPGLESSSEMTNQFDPAMLSLISGEKEDLPSFEEMKEEFLAQMSASGSQIDPMYLSLLNSDDDVDSSEMLKNQLMSQMASSGTQMNPMLLSMLNDDDDDSGSSLEMMKNQLMAQMGSSGSGTQIDPMLMSMLNGNDDFDVSDMLKNQMIMQMSSSGNQINPMLLSLLDGNDNQKSVSSDSMRNQLLSSMSSSGNSANPALLSLLDDNEDIDMTEILKKQLMSQMTNSGSELNPMMLSMLNSDDGDVDMSEIVKSQMISQMASSGNGIDPVVLSMLAGEETDVDPSKLLKTQLLSQMASSGEEINPLLLSMLKDEDQDSSSTKEQLKAQMMAQMATQNSPMSGLIFSMLDDEKETEEDVLEIMKRELLDQMSRDPGTSEMAQTLQALLGAAGQKTDISKSNPELYKTAFEVDADFARNEILGINDENAQKKELSYEFMFSMRYPEFKDQKIASLAGSFASFGAQMKENSKRLEDFAIEIISDADYKKDPLKMLKFANFSSEENLSNAPLVFAIGNLVNQQCISKGTIHDFAISILEDKLSSDAYRNERNTVKIQRELRLSVPWQSVLEKDSEVSEELKETVEQMILRDYRLDKFEKLSVEVKRLAPSVSIADEVTRVEVLVEISAKGSGEALKSELSSVLASIVEEKYLFIDISIPKNTDQQVLRGNLEKSTRVVLRSGWSKELENDDSLYSSQLKSVIKQAFADNPLWQTFGPLELAVEGFRRSAVFYYGVEADLVVKGVSSEDKWDEIFEYMQTVPGQSNFIGALVETGDDITPTEASTVTTTTTQSSTTPSKTLNSHDIIISLGYSDILQDKTSNSYIQYFKLLDLTFSEDDKKIDVLEFKEGAGGMTLATVNFPADTELSEIKKKVDAVYFLDIAESDPDLRRKRSSDDLAADYDANRRIMLSLALQYLTGKILIPFKEYAVLQNDDNSFLVDAAFEFIVKDFDRVHDSLSDVREKYPDHLLTILIYLNRLTEIEQLNISSFLTFFFNPESLMMYQSAVQHFSSACA